MTKLNELNRHTKILIFLINFKIEDSRWRVGFRSRQRELHESRNLLRLKPHLEEIKHKGESNLGHTEPLAHRKLLHATLH
jgi:hypothetical protein